MQARREAGEAGKRRDRGVRVRQEELQECPPCPRSLGAEVCQSLAVKACQTSKREGIGKIYDLTNVGTDRKPKATNITGMPASTRMRKPYKPHKNTMRMRDTTDPTDTDMTTRPSTAMTHATTDIPSGASVHRPSRAPRRGSSEERATARQAGHVHGAGGSRDSGSSAEGVPAIQERVHVGDRRAGGSTDDRGVILGFERKFLYFTFYVYVYVNLR